MADFTQIKTETAQLKRAMHSSNPQRVHKKGVLFLQTLKIFTAEMSKEDLKGQVSSDNGFKVGLFSTSNKNANNAHIQKKKHL